MVPQVTKKIIKLRKNGYSYNEICKMMKKSKRDVLKICKNIKFSKEGKKRYYNHVKGVKKPIKKQPSKPTLTKIRIISHLFFDGAVFKHEYHHVIMYVNSSKELISQFIKDFQKIYGLSPSALEELQGKQTKHYKVRFISKEAYDDLMKYTSSYYSSKLEKIPSFIEKGSKLTKLEFLRAFWEDEGSISTKNRNKVSADLKSHTFILFLSKFLKEIGINHNLVGYFIKDIKYYKIYLRINKKNLSLFQKYKLFNFAIASKGEKAGLRKKDLLNNLIKRLH